MAVFYKSRDQLRQHVGKCSAAKLTLSLLNYFPCCAKIDYVEKFWKKEPGRKLLFHFKIWIGARNVLLLILIRLSGRARSNNLGSVVLEQKG